MDYKHKAVLAEETVKGLGIKPDGVYVDGTLGGGGHASLICGRLGERGVLVGIDRDGDAIKASEEALQGFLCKKILVKSNFTGIRQILRDAGLTGIDGALLDLGVSSWQLDNPERGFSYMSDGPLDMRMDGSGEGHGLTAMEVVNTYSPGELARIIRLYGEERWAERIGEFIAREREKGDIGTTGELTAIIKRAIPAAARRDGPHPAKRTFQAIRIEVNKELEQLGIAIDEFMDALNPGGRFAVITFHSLEDRIVKDAFRLRENPCTCPPGLPACVCGEKPSARRVNRKPITAGSEELRDNPRARSAKLRIAEKL